LAGLLKAAPQSPGHEPGDAGRVKTERLTGWGRTAPSLCQVQAVTSHAEIADALLHAPARGVIPRGLGRSYGDLAQNGGGLVLDMSGLDAILDFDPERGTVVVAAGCSLATLLKATLPAGWFVPVTPGTRHVTVGGAIACDVHGKNHHRDGSFGRYVLGLTLLTPDGEVRRIDPVTDPDEFAATVGGLGLTGVIVEATLGLLQVETATVRVDVERSSDIEDTFARLQATDHLYRYSVAWVDCRARGARLGRSVLMRGDHATLSELPPSNRAGALDPGSDRTLMVPRWVSAARFLRGPSGDAFNELYFRRAHDQREMLQPLGQFFYPLDAVRNWNRLYGRAGFLQYQFVVPFGSERELIEIIRLLGSSRPAPVLAVLKRFGAESGPLSFPIAGWTLAADMALPAPELGLLLDRADDIVAAAGGRVYLAKDARLRPEHLEQMYPRLDEWREVQARLDPAGRMQGDLARRLRVVAKRSV
jgi:decaprenylphospho-beta-D-ribofuranose 2-oxidase